MRKLFLAFLLFAASARAQGIIDPAQGIATQISRGGASVTTGTDGSISINTGASQPVGITAAGGTQVNSGPFVLTSQVDGSVSAAGTTYLKFNGTGIRVSVNGDPYFYLPSSVLTTGTVSGLTLSSTNVNGVVAITLGGAIGTLNQNTTGSAATLTTPRAINGTNFDGSAAITITAAAGTLTGGTLASGVTASSLTSFGTNPTIGLANGTGLPESGVTNLTSDLAAKGTVSSVVSGGGLTSGTITTTGTISASTAVRTGSIGITIDGGGSAITTGVKGYISIPYDCTIQSVTTLADQSGSAVVDVWKDTYANYPPTVADTITASAKPTITSATKSTDATLTGWTTSVTAGDVIGFNVDSATTVTRLHLILKVLK